MYVGPHGRIARFEAVGEKDQPEPGVHVGAELAGGKEEELGRTGQGADVAIRALVPLFRRCKHIAGR